MSDLRSALASAGVEITQSEAELHTLEELLAPHVSSPAEYGERWRAYFSDDYVPFDDAIERLNSAGTGELLIELGSRLQLLDADDWSETRIEGEVRKLAIQKQMELADVAGAAQAAVTGQTSGPSVFRAIAAIGRERALRRLRNAD